MASEFHKQDALQCLSVAKKAVQKGDFEKAEKFGLKAKKLCDCKEVKDFLEELTARSTAGPSKKEPTLRQRPSRTQDEGTEEQRALVAKIKRAKDFYETLDIAQDAAEDDIKKAYKKLALKLHPDKNKAAGAEEAFKAVSRAFSCLSDQEKRRNYDRFGTEDHMQSGRSPNRQGFYADDIDAEELFNMFFGGGFPVHGSRVFRTPFGAPPFRRRPRSEDGHPNGAASGPTLTGLFSFLPLLLFFVLTFMSSPGERPIYNLYKEYPFEQEMVTGKYKVSFFVQSRPKFDRMFPVGSRPRIALEDQVEFQARRIYEDNCRQEKLQRKRIRKWQGERAAEKFELKSCHKLNEIFYSGSKNRRTVQSH